MQISFKTIKFNIELFLKILKNINAKIIHLINYENIHTIIVKETFLKRYKANFNYLKNKDQKEKP